MATESDDEKGSAVVSRRVVCAGLFATTGFTEAASADNPENGKIEIAAANLAAAMKERHGGEWRVNIDHESKLVVILESP